MSGITLRGLLHQRKGQTISSIFLLLSLFVGLLLTGSPHSRAAALTSGYFTTDTQLKVGMAVSLSETSTTDHLSVERATANGSQKVIGIVSDPNESLLAAVSGKSQVFVATSGDSEASVLDINGQIKKGDLLTISPIRGMLMKADETTTEIIGQALEDFAATSDTETITYQKSDGKSGTAHIDQLKMNINLQSIAPRNASPSYLEQVGEQLTHKDVSALQVVAAGVIFTVLLVIVGGVVYGAIANAVAALGRNPLSRNLIYGALFRMIGTAMVTLVIGLSVVYLVLWI
jgi:hypothetical protein